jgi:AbrB family looped-hinge helix DNA binding protein
MQTTQLSSKGQVVIPKALRDAKQWTAGTEFIVEATDTGILLREVPVAKKMSVKEGLVKLRAIVNYKGKPITIRQMNDAIAIEAKRRSK